MKNDIQMTFIYVVIALALASFLVAIFFEWEVVRQESQDHQSLIIKHNGMKR